MSSGSCGSFFWAVILAGLYEEGGWLVVQAEDTHTLTYARTEALQTVHVGTDNCYQCLELKPTPANFTQIKLPLFPNHESV